jgi:hypothetical protein
MLKFVWLVSLVVTVASCKDNGPEKPRSKLSSADKGSIQHTCSGPVIDKLRTSAKGSNLTLIQDAKACISSIAITKEDDRRQTLVAAPAPAAAKCPAGTLLDIYDRSRTGVLRSLFDSPVCGKTVSVNSKDTLNVDGQVYTDQGGIFRPVAAKPHVKMGEPK